MKSESGIPSHTVKNTNCTYILSLNTNPHCDNVLNGIYSSIFETTDRDKHKTNNKVGLVIIVQIVAYQILIFFLRTKRY